MQFDFVVLGATGMQGRIVVKDLLKSGYSVLLCGRDKPRILHFLKSYRKKTGWRYIEATKIKTISDAIKFSKSKIIINCMEGDWNHRVFQVCLKLGVHCIDLGSEIPVTRKQLALNKAMKTKNIVGITGIGSVPGIGNLMLKYAADKFDTLTDVEVGFAWDSNIKEFVVPFSIESVLEEFTDWAPVVEDGRFKYLLPLENTIKEKYRYVGSQRTLIVRHPEQYTFLKYFAKKGLKNIRFYAGFPEHSYRMIVSLVKLGFAKKRGVNYFGLKIIPVNFLKEMLKDLETPEGYTEKEILWVNINGKKNGKPKRTRMECLVPVVKGWEESGCNIDTGFPASILAVMIKEGIITERGSFSPEKGVPPLAFFKELRKKKIRIYENGKLIN